MLPSNYSLRTKMESSMRYLLLFISFSWATALTATECRNASDHCQTEFIQSLQQSSDVSSLCGGARRSLTCVESLVCESEIYLRIAIRIATRRLYDKNIQSCELGTHFPKDREYSKECQQKRETCMNAYVDNLLNHTSTYSNSTSHASNATTLCQDLNTFASCEMKQDSCQLKKEEVEKIAKEEQLRLTLPDCNVEALNKGKMNVLSIVLWLSTLLTLVLAIN